MGKIDKVMAFQIMRLLASGNDEAVMDMLRDYRNEQRQMQMERCVQTFSPEICYQTSAKPFYLWAQMAARKMINTNPLDKFEKSSLFM